jgi:hypothetical protein
MFSQNKPHFLEEEKKTSYILMIEQHSPLSTKIDGFLISPFSFTKTNISFENLFSSEVSPYQFASVFENISPASLPTPSMIDGKYLAFIQPPQAPKLQLPPDFKLKKKAKREAVKVEEKVVICTNNTTAKPIENPQPQLKTEGRIWKIVHVADEFKNENILIDVTSKTRCEEPVVEVPDVLYSSLKYEISQKFFAQSCKDEQFILSRISIVDSNGTTLSKSNMKGVTECSLIKTDNKFQGVLKCQFADLSHISKKSDLCWEINYYVPTDIQKSVMTVRSAPFKVYARKPTAKKRKASTFDEFVSRLDELVKASKKLKEEDKKLALEMVTSKFNEIDNIDFLIEENEEEEF